MSNRHDRDAWAAQRDRRLVIDLLISGGLVLIIILGVLIGG